MILSGSHIGEAINRTAVPGTTTVHRSSAHIEGGVVPEERRGEASAGAEGGAASGHIVPVQVVTGCYEVSSTGYRDRYIARCGSTRCVEHIHHHIGAGVVTANTIDRNRVGAGCGDGDRLVRSAIAPCVRSGFGAGDLHLATFAERGKAIEHQAGCFVGRKHYGDAGHCFATVAVVNGHHVVASRVHVDALSGFTRAPGVVEASVGREGERIAIAADDGCGRCGDRS